ncbi:discoidin domain-containing protein [Paenibacillus sp. P22]|uniref:discoidin domain-containing protein n=1 Tax=Paenibacillus TaxID=44249 RepID=UPI00040E5ECD|nr:discoidin domain-containing protein [Paenibacillus sp. P22]CDN44144.1 hypothetical protein BN871_EF_00270 [Paenibacillus sp. P22]
MMNKRMLNWLVMAALLLSLTAAAASVPARAAAAAGGESVIYGGGPFYSGGTATMNDLKASGFTTVMLWTIHVNANGDLVYNDQLVASGGSYVGKASWPSELASLKQGTTGVKRIELSVGSAAVNDFHNIQSLIASQGTGSGSILYRNFAALLQATGADAVSFDDEDLYDSGTTVSFGKMLTGLGVGITLCPYNNQTYWKNVKTGIGAKVDRIYLQVYDGGAGNSPAAWSSALGLTVMPGLDSKTPSYGNTPAQVQSRMAGWKSSAGIAGGFMWLYDDILKYSQYGSAADYAGAINSAVAGSTGNGSLTAGGTASASQGGSPSGEDVSKAFDGASGTKWLIFAGSGWLQYQFGGGNAYAARQYSLTSANDFPARDPKSWSLQGSNDGSSWTTLDTRSGETFASRFQTKTYAISNTSAFKYYRLNVTANNGGAELQLAELGLYA